MVLLLHHWKPPFGTFVFNLYFITCSPTDALQWKGAVRMRVQTADKNISQTSYILQTHSFSLHKTLTDGLEWCGLLVDYWDVFISCLDSHSDGTHSLQRIHWWASDVILNYSKSDEESNSSTYWMAWGRVHFQQIFSYYSFKTWKL